MTFWIFIHFLAILIHFFKKQWNKDNQIGKVLALIRIHQNSKMRNCKNLEEKLQSIVILGFVAGKTCQNVVIFEMKITKNHEKLQFRGYFGLLEERAAGRKWKFVCYIW